MKRPASCSKGPGRPGKQGFLKRTWVFLGSKGLSVFIFVMAMTYALILAAFGAIIPAAQVEAISALPAFTVLYVLFFINLLICEIKWIPVVLGRCGPALFPETEEGLKRFRFKIKATGPAFEVQGFKRYLRLRGYRVRTVKEESCTLVLHAARGRYSPLGNLLFHGGFIFFFIGAGMSAFMSFDGNAVLMEGQDFSGGKEEYSSIPASRGDMPEVRFKVEKITPQYWSNQLFFTDLRADIAYPDNGAAISGSARLSQPVTINGASVTISGLGFAPVYVIRDETGRELDSGYVRLNIFPPGSEDHFEIPGFPYRISVIFYPDHEAMGGNIFNRSMNPVNPLYLVRILRGSSTVFSGALRPGSEAHFDGLRLSFPETVYWGKFRVVKKPGHAFIWAGFTLFAAGLAWRFLCCRREVALVREGGESFLYANCDNYPRLFEAALKRVMGKES